MRFGLIETGIYKFLGNMQNVTTLEKHINIRILGSSIVSITFASAKRLGNKLHTNQCEHPASI